MTLILIGPITENGSCDIRLFMYLNSHGIPETHSHPHQIDIHAHNINLSISLRQYLALWKIIESLGGDNEDTTRKQEEDLEAIKNSGSSDREFPSYIVNRYLTKKCGACSISRRKNCLQIPN